MNRRKLLSFIALGLLVPGCGQRLGKVNGTVTLDGKPLGDAWVTFQPEDGSRPSVARTDSSGSYELIQTEKVKGAAVGKHKIIITSGGETDATSKKAVIIPEKVPAKYNVKSELVEDVRSGTNEINFGLDSKGEIIGVGKDPPSKIRTGCGDEEESDPDEPAAS